MKTITSRSTNNKVLIIDMESAWDEEAIWPQAIGVNLKNVEVVRAEHGEQACDIMEVCIQEAEFGLVALDSVGALITKEELENSHEKKQMASVAR